MSTDKPKVRYPINEAARRAQLSEEVLGRMIRAGQVDGAHYVAPEPGGKRGRWIIPAVPFDRQFGLTNDASTAEPDPGETPAGPTRSFLRKLA